MFKNNTKVLILLFAIFFLAYLLRVWNLADNVLTFGYDQARDALVSGQILSGDIKIQGPPASTPGLYHGVAYYYILAPGYLLGSGSPIVVAYWMAFINAATVFVIFYLTYLMTRKFLPAILAGFLFAISFESVQYATWLSNPTIAILFVPMFYLGLWMWLKEKSKVGPIIAAVGLGFSVQSEIFLLYHVLPLLIWLYIERKNIKRSQLVMFVVFFLASISTMALSEIKFGFRSIAAIRELAAPVTGDLAYAKSLGDYFILYLNQIGRIFSFNSYPGNVGYGGALVLILTLTGLMSTKGRFTSIQTYPFLATWLLSHITVVTVGGVSTPFLMVGIGPAVSVLLALFLSKLWPSYKLVFVVVLGLLIFGNISLILRENPKGATLFSIQKDMLLSKQLQVIDYTYRQANNEPFSVNTLTSPLWINIVWSYLYKWYGLPKYGYVPEFHGRDQIGQLDSLPKVSQDTTNYYLIIEPLAGIPPRYLEETIGQEDLVSRQIEENLFGEIRVQKRLKK